MFKVLCFVIQETLCFLCLFKILLPDEPKRRTMRKDENYTSAGRRYCSSSAISFPSTRCPPTDKFVTSLQFCFLDLYFYCSQTTGNMRLFFIRWLIDHFKLIIVQSFMFCASGNIVCLVFVPDEFKEGRWGRMMMETTPYAGLSRRRTRPSCAGSNFWFKIVRSRLLSVM